MDLLINNLVTFLDLFLNWLQVQQQGSLLLTHPITTGVALYTLVVTLFLLLIKVASPDFYQAYVRRFPFGVELFGSISTASTTSLLLSDSVRPLVYLIFLIVPARNVFYWMFQILEQRFGDNEFWIRTVLLVKTRLRRIMNRIVTPLLPL